MKKIPSLFVRDHDTHLSLRSINPECAWVVAGHGVATHKLDGTSCAIIGGELYKRYDFKPGRTPPAGWIPCEPDRDPITGHWPGWLLVGHTNEDQWHREAWAWNTAEHLIPLDNGTYELLGPKVQGNPYKLPHHALTRHGAQKLTISDRTYDGLKEYLEATHIEGIVFHHPDGRMAKVKRKDFGYRWPDPERAPHPEVPWPRSTRPQQG